MPALRGDVTTLREVAISDVYTLFTLFSDPAVTAYMAPPPPTLATFAGFVAWSHQEREQGRGLCFGIVPDGMTAAVGILQVRSSGSTLSCAEWGFVLSAHFWSTGVFLDAANLLVEFAFTTMDIECLQARIALRNRRAHAAVRRLGARPESTLATVSPTGFPRDPELVWTLREDDWRKRTRFSSITRRPWGNGSVKRSKRRKASCAKASLLRPSNPIRCSCLTVAAKNSPEAEQSLNLQITDSSSGRLRER